MTLSKHRYKYSRSGNILKKISSSLKGRRSRSKAGDFLLSFCILVIAAFSALPLIASIGMSLKPVSELFFFPPKLLPVRPTLSNFSTLFSLMNTTWVPFSRYIFNTVLITAGSTLGHVIVASMAAYPLAKNFFPGKVLLNNMVLFSLMFVPAVADVANYITISSLGWINTYLSIIIPNLGAPLGLFIIRNYMTTIPDSLLESARIDGCNEILSYWHIVMPIAKPAWLTVTILMFQQVWSASNTAYVYSEEMKTLPYALSQIVSGGLVRMGAGQAVGVLMLIIPVTLFVFNQTRITETMATSGIKE